MKKKPKIGRPKLPKGQGKGSVITIRLQKNERRSVGDAADLAGVKLSEWARNTLLSAAATSKIGTAETEAAGIEPHPTAYTDGGPGGVKPR
jgi:hypothetical protein